VTLGPSSQSTFWLDSLPTVERMSPSPRNRSSLIFFSGAGLPVWVWDDVRADLAHRGTVAPRPSTGSTVADYAQAALDAAPGGPLTVVAHSSGGLVATDLAAMAPRRVVAVLAIAAVIPLPHRSFTASLPFPQRLVLPVVLRLLGTRPPEAAIRASLGNGVSKNVVERLLQDFTPNRASTSRAVRVQGSRRPGGTRAPQTTLKFHQCCKPRMRIAFAPPSDTPWAPGTTRCSPSRAPSPK